MMMATMLSNPQHHSTRKMTCVTNQRLRNTYSLAKTSNPKSVSCDRLYRFIDQRKPSPLVSRAMAAQTNQRTQKMHRGNKDRMSALNNSSNEKWRMELDNSFHPDNTCRVRYSLRPKNRFDKEKRTIKGENGLMRGCFVEEAEKTPLEMEIEYRKGRQRMARTEVLAVRRSGFRHVEEVPLMKSKQPVNTRHVTQSTQDRLFTSLESKIRRPRMSNLRDQETRGRRYDVINHTQLEHERMIPNRPESPQTFYRMSKMNFPKGDALVDMKQRPPPLKSIAKEWGLDV